MTGDTDEKLDRLADAIDRLNTKFDRLGDKVDGLGSKVERLAVRVDGLDVKVGHLTAVVIAGFEKLLPPSQFREVQSARPPSGDLSAPTTAALAKDKDG